MWVAFSADEVRGISHYLGLLLLGLTAAMVLPLLTGVLWAEWDAVPDYLLGMAVSACVGVALMSIRPRTRELSPRQALLISALGWMCAAFVGAVPLALSGNYANYLDALFEAVSGFTTSGLTLVQDLDHMAHAHNMWRHLTHLIGGQGIIVAAVSLAVGLKGGAFSLYLAEGRDERILPNVMHTARFIWFVTAVWVSFGTLALFVANAWFGMDLGRGLLHAFWMTIAAYDTGGFGPQSQNALYYHSFVFEFLTVLSMLAGTLNFNLHADLWRGDLGEVSQNIEARTLFGNLFALSIFAAIGAAATVHFSSNAEIVRKGVYHIISANSGTGHQTLYASQWGELGAAAFFAVILAMSFGGMVSSTAGGIKALRIGLIIKAAIQQVKQSVSPGSAVVRTKFHHLVDRALSPEIVASALMVFVLYIVTYLTGGLIGAAYGYPLGDALFESVSATANVGLSTGIAVAGMPTGLKLLYIFQMWAGRLEFFTLLALVAAVIISIPRKRSRA
jgi:trk system potassium uptake protein TrkH